MKVYDLIKMLKKHPPEADIYIDSERIHFTVDKVEKIDCYKDQEAKIYNKTKRYKSEYFIFIRI